MTSRVENQEPLSLKERTLQWLKTEEASQVYEVLGKLDQLHHSRSESLPSFFNFDPKITELSTKKQREWLLNKWVVGDVRHAAYLTQEDRLILSAPAKIWEHVSLTSLGSKYDDLNANKAVFGMVAYIKSTGQEIFVPDHTSCGLAGLAPSIISNTALNDLLSKKPDFVSGLKISKDGLEKKGYTILIPDYDKNGRYQEKGKFTLLN